MADSAVGTSMMAGMTPMGLPSESTWSMNVCSAAVKLSIPIAVVAPEM